MSKITNQVIFGLVFLVLSLAIASAATSIVTPAASATIGGTAAAVNVTGSGLINCTIYVKSASTANSSWVELALLTNETNGPMAPELNGTIRTTSVEDASDYIINATCRNDTNQIKEDTNTGIVIDNTAPTATVSSPADYTIITSNETRTFTITKTNSVTTCTYGIGRNGASSGSDFFSGSATESGSTCYFTKAFVETDNGMWVWTITTTDGLNSSTSTGTHFQSAVRGLGGSTGVSSGVSAISTIPKQTFFQWLTELFKKLFHK